MCEKFGESFKALGITNEQIDKLIEKAGVTSSLKAFEHVKNLHVKAEQFLKLGENESAVSCYNDAIETPSLLPENLGTAYEKRAEYFLNTVQNCLVDTGNLQSALLDITKALELNESSWVAHHLAARYHRLHGNFSQAIHHYQRALSISPVQKTLKTDLDTCKVLASVQLRQDHLDPLLLPMSLSECIEKIRNETGLKMTEDEFLRQEKALRECGNEGQYHVFRGHRYFQGWGVSQNFQEAVKHYTKSAKLNNPDGMYYLAHCYHFGRGVDQNVKESLRICRDVAEMDPCSPGPATPLKRNCGVTAAQHAIGLMYETGIGAEQNFPIAASWYERAMKNGSASSANNLGVLYLRGQGVPRNYKMAEMCWLESVKWKDSCATSSLVGYYLKELEPYKAWDMVKVGRELGNDALINLSDEEFNKVATELRMKRDQFETKLVDFEKCQNLETKTKGLTFQERLDRMSRHEEPCLAPMQGVKDNSLYGNPGEPNDWGGKVRGVKQDDLLAIRERALSGSETAQRVMKTFRYLVEMNDLLEQSKSHSEEEKIVILNLTYDCVTPEHHWIATLCSPKSFANLVAIIEDLFERKCDNKSDMDMKARLCYTVINLHGSMSSRDMLGVELLKEGMKRYPDNVHYHHFLSSLMGLKQNYELGLYYAEEGLKIEPNNPSLLYDRAGHMFQHKSGSRDFLKSTTQTDECVEACKTFIKFAPNDHRKVPEIFYQISMLYVPRLEKGNLSTESGSAKLVKTYFELGKKAERRQLSCYLPYGESDAKRTVEAVLAKIESLFSPIKSARMAAGNFKTKPIYESKVYLKSVTRIALIREHRENLAKSAKSIPEKGAGFQDESTCPPTLTQTVVAKLSTVKPIHLQEMNVTKDHIFENRMLELTIIVDANTSHECIHLVAEDENGDVIGVVLYNVQNNKENLDKFGVGERIALLNPYMFISRGGINRGIRNDEPKCVVHLTKVESMCRYCGSENAKRKCSKCKRPYCSRECQVADWKELNHKILCLLKL